MINRILTVYNNLFILWVLLGGAIAFFYPQFFLPLKGMMEIFFAITMFGVGMVLDPRAFVDIIKNYKTVIIGVCSQFTVMPFLAFLFAHLFQFSNDFSIGLILAGSAPGAMASNVLCYLAGADVAYSVSLTTASTMLAPILTPLLTLLLAKTILNVPFWGLFFSVLKMVVLPLILGIILKKFLNKQVNKVIKIFPAISTTFIAFICALVIALNKSYILQINQWIFLAALLLNLGGLTAGYSIGHFFKFNILRKRALSIEIGMQNAGLGSVLALKHFNERAALPAVIFVFICIFTAALLVPIWSSKTQE